MNIEFAERLITLMQRRANDPTDNDLPAFDMEDWLEKEESEISCGTVGCIAGWATFLAYPTTPIDELDVGETAKNLLGLSREEAKNLFLGYWSGKFPRDITIQDAIGQLQYLVDKELSHA